MQLRVPNKVLLVAPLRRSEDLAVLWFVCVSVGAMGPLSLRYRAVRSSLLEEAVLKEVVGPGLRTCDYPLHVAHVDLVCGRHCC